VFADKADLFNRLVQRVCAMVDHQLDTPPHNSGSRSSLRRVRTDASLSLHNVSLMHRRRCDSQHITEEETPLCVELESLADVSGECRPVFVVADEELN